LSQKLGWSSGKIKSILDALIRLQIIEEPNGKYQILDSPFKEWLNSEEPPTTEYKEITAKEQLLVLQAIDKININEERPSAICDIYLFFDEKRFDEIKYIVEYLLEEMFIEKEAEKKVDGSKVVYYSLTRKGRSKMSEIQAFNDMGFYE